MNREDLDEVDRDALDRAISLTLAEADRAEQVQSMLAERGWWEAATFCAYHRQSAHLRLKPWETTPCWIDPDEADDILAKGPNGVHNEYGAAKLLSGMLASGISQYDPAPLDALNGARR